MELMDLVGTHKLSGVETGVTQSVNDWGEQDDCNFVKFTLDGVHYMAIEDPDDGYRSHCRDLQISDEPPKFSFQPQEMKCYMKENNEDYYEEDDILIMEDTTTGEVVMEIGTGHCDDYYPYFAFEYTPENMACNNPDISEVSFAGILGI